MQMIMNVRCENARCSDFDKVKTISRQHLGQHLYVGGDILCECGNAVAEIE